MREGEAPGFGGVADDGSAYWAIENTGFGAHLMGTLIHSHLNLFSLRFREASR